MKMAIGTAIAIGAFIYQIEKSSRLDAESAQKNSKAFTISADAQARLENANQKAFNALTKNAKRKLGILTCHLAIFQEKYEVIQKIKFQKGHGIEEIEKIAEVHNRISQYTHLPAVTSGKIMSDSQCLIALATMGIGGLMVNESERNLKIASSNLSKAHAVVAQTDSMCIVLEGIAEHAEIVSVLLQRLGMLYMKSIKNVEEILTKNGMNPSNYSDQDIEAINTSLIMTKLIYRIVNTPIIDPNGHIEQESVAVISEGQRMLDSIN